jgi:hypothetical protein
VLLDRDYLSRVLLDTTVLRRVLLLFPAKVDFTVLLEVLIRLRALLARIVLHSRVHPFFVLLVLSS